MLTFDDLLISATSVSPFTIELHSLEADNDPGLLVGFDETLLQSWLIAAAGDDVFASALTASALNFNDDLFHNPLAGGTFGLTAAASGWTSGLDYGLFLTFTPFSDAPAEVVPEPASLMLWTLVAAALVVAVCGRRKK